MIPVALTIPIDFKTKPFMLCSINPNTCSTLALVLDFSRLLAICLSVNGLLRYPFSVTWFLSWYFLITFSCYSRSWRSGFHGVHPAYCRVHYLPCFFYGFMLCDILHVHDKIYYIKAFAVGLAIGAKTVCRLGFVIHLHAWGLIFVERTV